MLTENEVMSHGRHQFTITGMLLLTALVAVSIGWWLDRQRSQQHAASVEAKLAEAQARLARFEATRRVNVTLHVPESTQREMDGNLDSAVSEADKPLVIVVEMPDTRDEPSDPGGQKVQVTESSLRRIVPDSVRFRHRKNSDQAVVTVNFQFGDQAHPSETFRLDVTLLDEDRQAIAAGTLNCRPEVGRVWQSGPVEIVSVPENSETMTIRAPSAKLARTAAMRIAFTGLPNEQP